MRRNHEGKPMNLLGIPWLHHDTSTASTSNNDTCKIATTFKYGKYGKCGLFMCIQQQRWETNKEKWSSTRNNFRSTMPFASFCQEVLANECGHLYAEECRRRSLELVQTNGSQNGNFDRDHHERPLDWIVNWHPVSWSNPTIEFVWWWFRVNQQARLPCPLSLVENSPTVDIHQKCSWTNMNPNLG